MPEFLEAMSVGERSRARLLIAVVCIARRTYQPAAGQQYRFIADRSRTAV